MATEENSWKAHLAHVREKGVLAMQLYVIFTRPTGRLDEIKQHLPEHLAFQKELESKGIMFGAGPLADEEEQAWTGEGMVIVRAGSVQEAREIAASDPMHKSGARSFTVRPWMLNEGSISLRVTFSDGGREIA